MDSNKRKLTSELMDSKKPKIAPFNIFYPTPKQFRESAVPQRFSLPIPIMKYIWSNPSSPEMYQKLIKNLKYHCVFGWECCSGNTCGHGYSCPHRHEKIDINGIDDKNIWVSKNFRVYLFAQPKLISFFIPKVHRYDVNTLELSGQHLSYNELKFLSTGVMECSLDMNIVKYENDEEVPLENIIQLFSGAQKVYINFGYKPYNATCKSYADFIVACQAIKELDLLNIPAIFDVPQFYEHLKCSKNHSLITILSDDNDRARLDEVVEEILQTKLFEFVPPVIQYDSQNRIKLTKMEEIQRNEAVKYQ